MSDDFADRLRTLFATLRGDSELDIQNLRRLSGGASRETFAFDITAGSVTERLVLQRDRASRPRGRMRDEVDVLQAAAAAGVKVPTVVASSTSPVELGAAYVIVGAVEGETIARRILRDESYAAARTNLVAQCAQQLALLHRIDPATTPGLDDADQLDTLRAAVDGLGAQRPAFELAFRWLEQHRPAPPPPSIVHGDFRLGNLVVNTEGLAAVLDWELAHIGDPIEDLGWMCVRAWRFGSEHVAAGLASRADLMRAYTRAGGTSVDEDSLHWWEVLGTLKWGVICLVQSRAHLDGTSRSVELAAIGRRVCETEYDLMGLLP